MEHYYKERYKFVGQCFKFEKWNQLNFQKISYYFSKNQLLLVQTF